MGTILVRVTIILASGAYTRQVKPYNSVKEAMDVASTCFPEAVCIACVKLGGAA